MPGSLKRPITFPVESGINDHTLGHLRGTIALITREIEVRIADRIAKQRIAPADVSVECLRIGVKQQLRGIEPMSSLGLIRTVNSVAVSLTRLCLGQVDVPDVIGLLANWNACDLPIRIVFVEEA